MTTYNVALNFEDGVTRVIQCDDDEKVTDAAFRQKINLPMDCRMAFAALASASSRRASTSWNSTWTSP